VDLVRVVERCLEKDPSRRWQSCAELRDAWRGAALPTGPPAPAGRASAPVEVRIGRRARHTIVGAGAVSLAALALDLALGGGVDFAPFVFGLALTVGALAYGRAAAAGLSPATVLRPSGPVPPAPTPPSEEPDLGMHASAVRQARADRATVLGLLARMPAVERKVLGEALPELDRRLTEAAELARQANSLERSLERLADPDERQRADQRRTEILARLRTDLSDIHDIRVAVRHAARDGLAPGAERLATVLARRGA
jgi:hypothetical protein